MGTHHPIDDLNQRQRQSRERVHNVASNPENRHYGHLISGAENWRVRTPTVRCQAVHHVQIAVSGVPPVTVTPDSHHRPTAS